MKNIKTKLKTSVLAVSLIFALFISVFGIFGGATPALAASCNSRTLTGVVDTGTPPARSRFEYATSYNTVVNNGGSTTPVRTFNTEGSFPVDEFISGLSGNTTYFYRLVVTNNFGTTFGTVEQFTTPSCAPTVQPPTVDITADSTNVQINGSTTVRWTSQNATTCTASGGTNGWSGPKSLSGSFFTGNLTNTVTYNIMCSNSAGSATDSVTINVTHEPEVCRDPSATNYGGPLPCKYAIPPTVNLTADNSNVPYNGSTVLRWTSQNAISCNGTSGTNGWSGPKSLSGSFFTGNLTNTTSYGITCVNSAGQQASDFVTVTVQNKPPQTCQDYNAINYGGPLPCKYAPQTCQDPYATNYGGPLPCKYAPTTCQDPAATNYGGPLPCKYAPTTCQDPNATNYGGPLPCKYQQQPTVNLTADDTIVDSGESTILRWTSQNATTCNASGGTNGWSGSKSLSGSFFTGPLTSDRTYTITCSNSVGSATDSVTVRVEDRNDERPTVDIRVDDASLESGDSTTVRWSSHNADTCRTSGGRNGWAGRNVNTSGSFNTGSLTNDTTYSITCTNESGSADDTDSVTVRVDEEEEEPTVSIFANPSSVPFNGSSTITWNSNNADTCRANGGTNGWSGQRSLSGNFFTGPLSGTTSFSITCTNESGSDSASTTVFVSGQPVQPPVNNQPTVSIFADSTNIAFNGTTTVRWNTTNATSCFASGGSTGWAGPKSIGPGSFFTGSLTATRTYTITCNNDVGSATDSVTVNVRGQVLGTTTVRPVASSLVLVTSTVDRNQPIVPTLDNTNPCPGDDINYTITYQNIGTGAITALALRVDMPFEVDYISSNPSNPIRSGNTLIFNLGTLRANGSGTVTIKVHVRENTIGGSNLNFPAVLSYIDPAGFPQSVAANVSAGVCSAVVPAVVAGSTLGASVFGAGFLPTSIFGWLLLLILILILVLLAKYLFGSGQEAAFRKRTVTTFDAPLGNKTTTTL